MYFGDIIYKNQEAQKPVEVLKYIVLTVKFWLNYFIDIGNICLMYINYEAFDWIVLACLF